MGKIRLISKNIMIIIKTCQMILSKAELRINANRFFCFESKHFRMELTDFPFHEVKKNKKKNEFGFSSKKISGTENLSIDSKKKSDSSTEQRKLSTKHKKSQFFFVRSESETIPCCAFEKTLYKKIVEKNIVFAVLSEIKNLLKHCVSRLFLINFFFSFDSKYSARDYSNEMIVKNVFFLSGRVEL